jgi:alpha-beta hydrolase superfamily lysophospholipase
LALDQAIVSPTRIEGAIVASISSIPLKLPGFMRVLIKAAALRGLKVPAEPQESFLGAKDALGRTDLWKDPLCPSSMTLGMVRGLTERQAHLADDLRHLRVPVLFLAGSLDTIAKPDPGLLDLISSRDKLYKEYANAGHDLFSSDEYEAIIGDITAWLDERIGK